MVTYPIPAGMFRAEIEVFRSRFIATVGFAETTDDSRQFIAQIRDEMPTASHHVYAFRVGYGNNVIEGMSDDGEPSGTAGPPILSILRGTDIGDIVVVVTRYFGGTKLGTGGLVRAYSEATRLVMDTLNTIQKIETRTLGIDISYSLYDRVKLLLLDHDCIIEDETFAGDISLILRLPVENVPKLESALADLSSGRIGLIFFD